MSEAMLRAAVERTIELYEQANNRPATRTRQMIDEHGEIETLSRLMLSANLQQGFQVLRDSNRLNRTFEALVIRFQKLFTPEVVEAARWRLDHPFDLL